MDAMERWMRGGRVGPPPAPTMVARPLPARFGGGPRAATRSNVEPRGATGPARPAPLHMVAEGRGWREAIPGEGGPGWAIRGTAR